MILGLIPIPPSITCPEAKCWEDAAKASGWDWLIAVLIVAAAVGLGIAWAEWLMRDKR